MTTTKKKKNTSKKSKVSSADIAVQAVPREQYYQGIGAQVYQDVQHIVTKTKFTGGQTQREYEHMLYGMGVVMGWMGSLPEP